MMTDLLASVRAEADALELHCRRRLAASCYGLAVRMAKDAMRVRKWPNGSNWDAILSEALLGPVMASKTFEPGRGAKFATYAHRAIRFRLQRVHAAEWGRAAKGFWGQLARTRHVWMPGSAGGTVSQENHVIDRRAGPEELAEAADEDARRKAEVSALLSRITNDNRRAVAWRHFGLGESQEAIARDVRLSRQRVNQLCLFALAEMRGDPWPPRRELPAGAKGVAAAYAAGEPMADICRRFGVCEKTVQRWREAAGVKVRPGGRPRNRGVENGA